MRPIFGVYGSNGTEFSYGFFLVTTEFENDTTAIRLRSNGNVMVETRQKNVQDVFDPFEQWR